ncbi:MAG: xylulokinase [Candidatus Izemoplasmatales bacterium]|nr:xylulokinase [Candidatus Izemoplasmatales bacterium]
MTYFIGIDVGTSSSKAILFDQLGNEVASAQQSYSFSQPQPGYAEQNPDLWWNAVSKCLRELVHASSVQKEEILALGVTGQMHGLVMLDKDDQILRESIIWCDQRTIVEAEELDRLIGRESLLAITGNPALTGFTASKILWVKKHEPDLWARCQKILLPKDYVVYKLTGRHATDVSDASGTQLLDLKTRDWSPSILTTLEISRDLLGTVFESGDIVGNISMEAAQLTHLSMLTQVIAGAGDQAAAAVGNGIIKPQLMSLNLGSSGVLFASTDQPLVDPKGRIHSLCHAVPNTWHVMAVTQGAGLSHKWFRDQFYGGESNKKFDLNQIMEQEAGSIPLGSEGLMFLPYLMGERSPHLDSFARGVFFGITPVHTRAHFARAVMEGVAFSFKDCLEVMEYLSIDAAEIRMSGGGANSPLWTAIITNCLKRPLRVMRDKEAGACGMAILAMVAAKAVPTIDDAMKLFVHPGEQVIGNPCDMDRYNRLFPLFQSLYQSLKGSFVQAHQLIVSD